MPPPSSSSSSDDIRNFMYNSCEKISRVEANQAFRSGMQEGGVGPTRGGGGGGGSGPKSKKRGYTSCARGKKNPNNNNNTTTERPTKDETWAQQQPKLEESLEVRKQQSAVGRGLFVRKSFRKSSGGGFEKGEAIGEYVGERILEDEYQSRIDRYQQDKEFNYIVGVDTGEVSGLYIDATKKGNWTRFVNNSHEPNAQFEPVIIGGTWRIFLVAVKRIRPGEEVTIDYGSEYRAPDQKFVQCFCSSSKCSGVIGVPMDKKAITKLLLNDIHYQDDDLNILCGEKRLLEAHNKQLRKQIAMIKPMIVKMLDEVFIPITDHREEDVRTNNTRVVREILNEQQLSISGAPGLTPCSSTPVVAAIGNSGRRRSSTRSSKRSADPVSGTASSVTNEEDGDDRVTPPPAAKKRRTSSRLSVHKIPGCVIESTIMTPESVQEKVKRWEKSPASVVGERIRRTASSSLPPALPVREQEDDDDDDDIIDVTPDKVTRALPPPASTDARSDAVTRETFGETIPRSRTSFMDQIIDWYKTMKMMIPSNSEVRPPCPIHKKDKMRLMREVRKHFFLNHAGAANTYKEQLERMGRGLSESENALFQESQRIRNAP